MNTQELTTPERLVILRRRRNESQGQAARRLGVTLYRYRLWEDGSKEPGENIETAILHIKIFEVCFIRRRRLGLSSKEMASKMNCSRWWLTQMEKGTVDHSALIRHWKKVDELGDAITK